MMSIRPSAKTALILSLVGAIAWSEWHLRIESARAPIKEGEHVLAHEIYDSSNSKHALVFLHGWPDDASLFKDMAKHFSSSFRCISCNLPGYPLSLAFKGNVGTVDPATRRYGFTLDEAVLALKNTIDEVCSGCESVTLITHDWGAIVGYLLDERYPQFLQRMVSFDIGWRVDGRHPVGFAYTIAYQGFLNVCFMIPNSIGSILTDRLSKALGRIPAVEAAPVSNDMNWPYRAAWRDLFTNGAIKRMDKYVPSPKPMLFIYSSKTSPAFRFSDEGWYAKIEASFPNVSSCIPHPGNHWMMNSHPEEIRLVLSEWLEKSGDAMRSGLRE